MRILLVEDDKNLNQQLTEKLREHGFVVDCVFNGQNGIYYGTEYPVDIAIIDLGLPDINGIEVVESIRKKGKNYPILILTARTKWQEKVRGFEAGADDYLTKPFYFEELQARISALIRRAAGHPTPILINGFIRINTRTNDVFVNDVKLELTGFEYRLLNYLMMNIGKVVSKMELMEHLYEEDSEKDSNVIEVIIYRLRNKLDPDNTIQPIRTIRRSGYCFVQHQLEAR